MKKQIFFKKLKSMHGFSMVELMVVAGVMGVMALGFSTMMRDASRTQRRIESRVGYRNIINEIQMLMLNPVACSLTLGADVSATTDSLGRNVFAPRTGVHPSDSDALGIAVGPFSPDHAGGTGTSNITRIFSSKLGTGNTLPRVVYEASTDPGNPIVYENRTVSIQSMRIAKLDASVVTPNPGVTQPLSCRPNEGECAELLSLEIELREEAKFLDTGLASTRTKFYRIPILTIIDTTKNNEIVGCASTGDDQFLIDACISMGGYWDASLLPPEQRCNLSDVSARYACDSIRGRYSLEAGGSLTGNHDSTNSGGTFLDGGNYYTRTNPDSNLQTWGSQYDTEACDISAVSSETACQYFGGRILDKTGNDANEFQGTRAVVDSNTRNDGPNPGDDIERCSLEGNLNLRRMACRLTGGDYDETNNTCVSAFETTCLAMGGVVQSTPGGTNFDTNDTTNAFSGTRQCILCGRGSSLDGDASGGNNSSFIGTNPSYPGAGNVAAANENAFCNRRVCERDLGGNWNDLNNTCNAREQITKYACEILNGGTWAYSDGGTGSGPGAHDSSTTGTCTFEDGKAFCQKMKGTWDDPSDTCSWSLIATSSEDGTLITDGFTGSVGAYDAKDAIKRMACAEMASTATTRGARITVVTGGTYGAPSYTTYMAQGSYSPTTGKCYVMFSDPRIASMDWVNATYVSKGGLEPNGSVVIGTNLGCGTDSVCIGKDADGTASANSVAMGSYADIAGGSDTVAIGSFAASYGAAYSVAIGYATESTYARAVSLGMFADARNTRTMCLGYNADCFDAGGTAIGEQATPGTDSFAAGYNADSGSVSRAVTIGYNSDSLGNSSIAIGESARADTTNNIAIGTGAITDDGNNISIGNNASSDYSWSIAIGTNALADDNASNSIASVAIGNDTRAIGYDSLAVGDICSATGNYSTTYGARSSATSNHSTAIGYNCDNGDNYSIELCANENTSGRRYDEGAGWENPSTRDKKLILAQVQPNEKIMDEVMALPIYWYHMKDYVNTDPYTGERRKSIGPVSEEYHELWNDEDGGSNKTIRYGNLWIRNVLATQFLGKENKKDEAKISKLEKKKEHLEQEVDGLETEISGLKEVLKTVMDRRK